MKSIVRWRGVKSPKTGWQCESMSPGMRVLPLASMTVSASASRPRPSAANLPSVDERRRPVEERPLDVPRDDLADVLDQRPHQSRVLTG